MLKKSKAGVHSPRRLLRKNAANAGNRALKGTSETQFCVSQLLAERYAAEGYFLASFSVFR